MCEGLLAPERFTPGAFDLATHRALAEFERKNDIFGWGFISGETKEALQQPPARLHFETLKRILAERVAEAAGILEDGSVGKGGDTPTYVDEAGGSSSRAQPHRRLRHRATRGDGCRDAAGPRSLPARAKRRDVRDAAGRLRAPAVTALLRCRHGSLRRDRSRRRLVRRSLRRRRQAARATALAVSDLHALRHVARAEDTARTLANDHRLVAQRARRRRPHLPQVQELRRRASRLEEHRRGTGVAASGSHAGKGSADPEGARSKAGTRHGGEYRGDGARLRLSLRPGDGDPSPAAPRRGLVRQPDPHARLRRLHVDRAAVSRTAVTGW